MLRRPRPHHRPLARRPRGFILGYIMVALILLGVVTAGMSRLQLHQCRRSGRLDAGQRGR
jgi:Tfp pilus assembly protein PilX